MSAEQGPVLPPVEGQAPGTVDPALDPFANSEGTPDAAPGTGAEAQPPTGGTPGENAQDGAASANNDGAEAPESQGAGAALVEQSRDAFQDAQERGKSFLHRVGQAATRKLVSFRKKSSGEATETDKTTTDTAEQTKPSWGERAKSAKKNATEHLEERWNARQEEATAERTRSEAERMNKRLDKQAEREDRARQRAAEHVIDRINKRNMTREEYQDYKLQKRIERNREIIMKQYNKGVARKEARHLNRDRRAAEHMNRQFDKTEEKSQRPDRRASYEYGDLKTAYADILENAAGPASEPAETNQQRERWHQRARRVGANVLRVANYADMVVVGAGIVGGETAAKHARQAAENLGKNERVQHAKTRARRVGQAALHGTFGNFFGNSSAETADTTAAGEPAQPGDTPEQPATNAEAPATPLNERQQSPDNQPHPAHKAAA